MVLTGNFILVSVNVWWRDDLNCWRVGGGEITSPVGEVDGGEVTCGGEMVGGEASWWRDDWMPTQRLVGRSEICCSLSEGTQMYRVL